MAAAIEEWMDADIAGDRGMTDNLAGLVNTGSKACGSSERAEIGHDIIGCRRTLMPGAVDQQRDERNRLGRFHMRGHHYRDAEVNAAAASRFNGGPPF